MSDDTSTTLGHILGCDPWDVVRNVEQIQKTHQRRNDAIWTRYEAERRGREVAESELADLRVLLDEVAVLGNRHPHLTNLRLVKARRLAPQAGRFRSAILKALRRGHDWGISEAEYEKLLAEPCRYCGGPLGNGIALDRLNEKVGYFPTNVVPSCGPCNMAQHRKGAGNGPDSR